MKPFYVYVLRCADGSFYAGHTDDLDARMLQHSLGRFGYTASRRPVELLWQGEFETRDGALAFEQRIKGWSREKKQALMAGDWEKVRSLAVSYGGEGRRQAGPSSGAGGHTERTGSSTRAVRPEPVEGLRQAQPERDCGSGSGLRQAQPERTGFVGVGLRQAQPERTLAAAPSARPEPTPPVRPEPVEGHRPPVPEPTPPVVGEPTPSVRPEPVEGHRPPVPEPTPPVVAGPTPSVRPEPVEGHRPPVLDLTSITTPGPAQRRAVAKAITLLESTRPDHRAQADNLLTELLPHTGNSFRLGISGVPGVGKSTFIEALGLYLIEQGHRVAVLAIDPSSSVSGGSILGDKTRMERLSVHERAYIRPSPASGTLGGVAEKTREAMLVCEAAGYDVVIVETVGVGQSETAVAGMTDLFVLMQLPNAGDDLQAIKKGVMELADLVVINKADLDPDAATRAQAQITSAMRLFTQHGRHHDAHADAAGKVLQLSALQSTGIQAFWQTVTRLREQRSADGSLQARRRHQALAWMWERIEAGLRQEFRQHPAVQALLPTLTQDVEAGRLPASTAARELLNARHTR